MSDTVTNRVRHWHKPAVIDWVIGMYAMMVNGRTLGILYREREEELGWI